MENKINVQLASQAVINAVNYSAREMANNISTIVNSAVDSANRNLADVKTMYSDISSTLNSGVKALQSLESRENHKEWLHLIHGEKI
jgi:hypothetical protein